MCSEFCMLKEWCIYPSTFNKSFTEHLPCTKNFAKTLNVKVLITDLVLCNWVAKKNINQSDKWMWFLKNYMKENTQFSEVHIEGTYLMLESQRLSYKIRLQLTVHFSRSVVPNSLGPHGLQQARSPCPSPTPRVHPNPCPLSQWCHPTISSSVIPFSSCPQSFPASGSFPTSQLSASDGQSIGVLASTSVPPMNTQEWSPLGWTGWISLQSKRLLRVFSNLNTP